MTCSVPVASLYQRQGGDAGIRDFVSRPYDVMAAGPIDRMPAVMVGRMRNRDECSEAAGAGRGCGGQCS